jgi:transposase, IS30 family
VRGTEVVAEEREIISRELAVGSSFRHIARLLNRDHSVVSREVTRNGDRLAYRVIPAQRRADEQRARPKPRLLEVNTVLHDAVNAGLEQDWSPQQISKRWREDYPDDDTMRVSAETIYESLSLQARGELRTQLKIALRQGRTCRVRRSRPAVARGKIRDMVNISERPAEAADRAVPGFWEGDLILGKGGTSQIATLVERTSRFTLLVRIPSDRTATRVSILLGQKMEHLPEFLRNSMTWDQGKEMADHANFTVKTGIDVYFCDPHSPWQRGSNENTNGLLRQYFPKGTDLSDYTQAELDAVADKLNNRPRQTLNWKKPTEVLNTFLVEAG